MYGTHTPPDRPSDPPIPDYRWVPGSPDRHGSTAGCAGCDFRRQLSIRCSRIPCQTRPGMMAKIINQGA